MLYTRGGDLVVSPYNDGGNVGRPVLFLAPNGNATPLPGVPSLRFTATDFAAGLRRLSSGTDGTFWAAEVQRFAIRRYRADGTQLRNHADPDLTNVLGLFEDSTGILWVVSRRTSGGAPAQRGSDDQRGRRTQSTSPLRERRSEAERRASIEASIKATVTILRAYDAATMTLLAERQYPGRRLLAAKGFLYERKEDRDGVSYYLTVVPTLTRGGGS